MSYNQNNNNVIKKTLINYLINYLMEEEKKVVSSNDVGQRRYNLTIRISRDLYERYNSLCHNLGLVKRGHTNVALEGLIAFFMTTFNEQPPIIQPKISHFFVKAEPGSQVTIAQKQVVIQKMDKDTEDARQKLKLAIKNFDEIAKLPKSLEYYLCKADKYENLPEALEFKELSKRVLCKGEHRIG